MPKGALLHVHQYATVEAGFLLNLALQQPAIHIRCPNVIDNSTIAVTLPDIRPIPNEQYTHGCGITDAAYVPNTWVEMRTARETFDPSLGGPEGFDKWITSTFVISPGEAYGSHNTPNKVRPILRILCRLLREQVPTVLLRSGRNLEVHLR
jgi:adenosine deaminase CECR1